ncbi:hypothetical protein M407DRAFT_33334 [Tulasnella calospora MUT 4182]|uniref:Uncharacterized protein n=1 Tax=Tulasnella calospora MUT 4182 TaxID=1051891 RepID=A0A0C3PQY3_9AGAM|nr:hypothetical protein M407DRAFT_33334 [Tulasnella calospora MUT 4182]
MPDDRRKAIVAALPIETMADSLSALSSASQAAAYMGSLMESKRHMDAINAFGDTGFALSVADLLFPPTLPSALDAPAATKSEDSTETQSSTHPSPRHQIGSTHPNLEDNQKVQSEQSVQPTSSAAAIPLSKEVPMDIPRKSTLGNAVIDKQSSASSEILSATNAINPDLHVSPTTLPSSATVQPSVPAVGVISPKADSNADVTPSRPMTASKPTLTNGPRKPAILSILPHVGLPLNTQSFMPSTTLITSQSKPKSQLTAKPASNLRLPSVDSTILQSGSNLSRQRLNPSPLATDSPIHTFGATSAPSVSPSKVRTPQIPAGGDAKRPPRTPLLELNSEDPYNTNKDHGADPFYGEETPGKPQEDPHRPSLRKTLHSPDGMEAVAHAGSAEPDLLAANEFATSQEDQPLEYDSNIDDGDPDDEDDAEWSWEHNKKKADEWEVDLDGVTFSDPCHTAPLLTRWMYKIRVKAQGGEAYKRYREEELSDYMEIPERVRKHAGAVWRLGSRFDWHVRVFMAKWAHAYGKADESTRKTILDQMWDELVVRFPSRTGT